MLLHSQTKVSLSQEFGSILSILYHDIFDYPLTQDELLKWTPGIKFKEKFDLGSTEKRIIFKNGYYFLKGRRGIVYKRILRGKLSERKLDLAKKYAKIIGLIPSIRMVAITGSLAMRNSHDGSDIDLLTVTRPGTLWMTRALTYLLLFFLRVPVRFAGKSDEKDKLCLNMWIDEGNLMWRKRGIYTAHEIAQVVPVVDKGEVYKKLLKANRWISDFWPLSVSFPKKQIKLEVKPHKNFVVLRTIESIAYKLQRLYMAKKISNETVSETRALFHPNDWGKFVERNLLTKRNLLP